MRVKVFSSNSIKKFTKLRRKNKAVGTKSFYIRHKFKADTAHTCVKILDNLMAFQTKRNT